MAFERRDVSDPVAERQVRRALSTRDGTATLADLVVATGLPELTVEHAVSRLIDSHDGAIGVAPGGALRYRFLMGPFGIKRRREKQPLWRAAVRTSAAVMSASVRAFEIAFRTVLAVQLLVYMIVILTPLSLVAGVVVGIGLLIAVIFSGEDVSGLFEVVTDPYGAAFVLLGSWAAGTYVVFQKKIAWLTSLVGRDERGKKGVAGFIAQINDFALGPDKPSSQKERIDRAWRVSQDDERRILERIRKQGGHLRAGHLVQWLGFDFAEAERQAARIAVEYGGVPEASEIDVLDFSFASLLDTMTSKDLPREERTAYERGITLPRLTANSVNENLVIAGFGLVNLTIAGLADHFLRAQMVSDAGNAGWWHAAAIAGGTLPFAFSSLLFTVFAVRIPFFALRTLILTRHQQRAQIHDALVTHARKRADAPFDLRKLKAPTDLVRAVAVGLEGSFALDSVDDPTKTVWRFTRLSHELQTGQ